jgi:glycosyltransferase involved in cell wall biosynthesis
LMLIVVSIVLGFWVDEGLVDTFSEKVHPDKQGMPGALAERLLQLPTYSFPTAGRLVLTLAPCTVEAMEEMHDDLLRLMCGKKIVPRRGILSFRGVAGRALVILHYHFRPGGVRRVIERALPELVRQGNLTKVVFFSGEPVPELWWQEVAVACPGVELASVIEPEATYVSELGRQPSVNALRRALKKLWCTGPVAAWLHNPALGRNPLLVRETVRTAQAHGVPLLLHNHDFWCDNRWQRWRELETLGYRHPDDVARDLFPSGPGLRHVALTSRDARLLRRGGGRVALWPNSFDPTARRTPAQRRITRHWLRQQTGVGPKTRFWVLPCRLLRRKNVLEALHLCRHMDSKAILVTSAQPSSAEEMPYARWLQNQVRRHRWPLYFVNPGPTTGMDHLLEAADVVTLTSLQEGFGLAYLEANAAGRPLVCRRLPGIDPDLRRWGFTLPHSYEETLVPCDAFSLGREQKRQAAAWQEWRASLPSPFQALAEYPPLLADTDPSSIGFSRLTAAAQAEVLQKNPPPTPRPTTAWVSPPWPEAADKLSGANYARRFWREVRELSGGADDAGEPCRSQNALVADRLHSANLYPLLFSTRCP